LNAGRLVLGDVLGEGAFGVVLKAEAQGIASDRNAETTVAVKTLKGRPFKRILSYGVFVISIIRCIVVNVSSSSSSSSSGRFVSAPITVKNIGAMISDV